MLNLVGYFYVHQMADSSINSYNCKVKWRERPNLAMANFSTAADPFSGGKRSITRHRRPLADHILPVIALIVFH